MSLSSEEGNFFDLGQLNCASVRNIKEERSTFEGKNHLALGKRINKQKDDAWGTTQPSGSVQEKYNINPSKKLYFGQKFHPPWCSGGVTISLPLPAAWETTFLYQNGIWDKCNQSNPYRGHHDLKRPAQPFLSSLLQGSGAGPDPAP